MSKWLSAHLFYGSLIFKFSNCQIDTMELSTIIPHIEALIFASEKPLTNLDIVELINNAFAFMEERITLDQVESAVEGIREKYNAEFYPFEVRESGGGWQFLTKKEFHKTVGQLNGDKFLKRLSNAALETLAIIAYKQPITKGEVEAIRGVNSDYSIQKLLEKELIIISGRNDAMPGKPLVYATSKSFMDYFGLNSVEDLPKIREVLAEQVIQGTIISEGMKKSEADQAEDESSLTVTDTGELMEYKLKPGAEAGEDEDERNVAEPGAIPERQEANEETDDNDISDDGDEESVVPLASDLEAFSDVGEEEANDDTDDGEEETEPASNSDDLPNDLEEETTPGNAEDIAEDDDTSSDETSEKTKED